MARAKRVELSGGNGAVARGVLADVPSVAALEARLVELTAEAARVERLLACLRSMDDQPVEVTA